MITYIDGYKLDHRRQYPPGTETVYSNWTARSSRIPGQDEVVFFGLQYFLRKYLMENRFFVQNKDDMINKYTRLVNNYLGPNSIGTSHIASLWELGYFPLRFMSLPEGARVPLRVPIFTVENTLPEFFWLVNYIETLISNVLWMPTTSATIAYRYRKLLNEFCVLTGSDEQFVPWQGHDFSFRGMAGVEAAALSGAGHLLSFTGTDTIPAVELINEYYQAAPNIVVGGSVTATEHSVMCAGGEANESETFERLLNLYPEGVLSIVSDTWNLWEVITDILPIHKDFIMARPGKLVIRPDSGDPVKIICGDPDGVTEAERKGVVELLWDLFGGTTTSTGQRMLDPHIGVIYGDSITYERCEAILKGLYAKGFASGNMVFGIGSYTYQYNTRDTFGFAMKATWAQINGKGHDLFKKPVTDDGTKFSATGRLVVCKDHQGKFYVMEKATQELEVSHRNEFKNVWLDGRFRAGMETNIARIRNLLWAA